MALQIRSRLVQQLISVAADATNLTLHNVDVLAELLNGPAIFCHLLDRKFELVAEISYDSDDFGQLLEPLPVSLEKIMLDQLNYFGIVFFNLRLEFGQFRDFFSNQLQNLILIEGDDFGFSNIGL